MAIRVFESEILEIKNLTPSVKYLKLSKPEDFEFKPGQYLSFSFYIDGKKLRTPYSIASLPGENYIEFCIKLVEKGKAPKFIKTLKKADKVELFGPAGKFFINEHSINKDLIFISAGTGISTFISMIPYLLKTEFKNKLILLKGFRSEEEILYDKELSELEKNHKNFKFYNILSQPKNKNFLNKGYVQGFLEKYIPKNFKGDFYICGLSEMINRVIKNLKELNIEENRMFFEKYD